MAKTYGLVQSSNYPDIGGSLLAHNLAATAAPGVSDDSAAGYGVGSIWLDVTHGTIYSCVSAGVGAAVWRQVGGAPNSAGGGTIQSDSAVQPLQALGVVARWSAGEAAAASATAVHAAVADNGGSQTISTGITQPPCCRNLTFTPSGTTANVTAVSMVVTGTDKNDAVITETFPAFTAGQATAVVGVKAFKTVTSYVQPACGASVSISCGTGSKLGLDHKLACNTVLAASLNGVREGTAPTVAVDGTNLCGNHVTLNSALNGTAVRAYYLVP